MKTQTIPREKLAELYNMSGVCSKYKTKIETYLKNDLFAAKIAIFEGDIEDAFGAANREQVKVMLKYFKRASSEIENWKDILRINKITEASLKLILNPKTKEEQSRNGYTKLLYIGKAYNKGWIPNFKDTSEEKWYVYKYYSGGRWFVGVLDNYGYVCRPSGVYFKTKKDALDSYNKFKDIYEGYWMVD